MSKRLEQAGFQVELQIHDATASTRQIFISHLKQPPALVQRMVPLVDRLLISPEYAHRVVERLLEYLVDGRICATLDDGISPDSQGVKRMTGPGPILTMAVTIRSKMVRMWSRSVASGAV
jgi:hypothetical protein